MIRCISDFIAPAILNCVFLLFFSLVFLYFKLKSRFVIFLSNWPGNFNSKLHCSHKFIFRFAQFEQWSVSAHGPCNITQKQTRAYVWHERLTIKYAPLMWCNMNGWNVKNGLSLFVYRIFVVFSFLDKNEMSGVCDTHLHIIAKISISIDRTKRLVGLWFVGSSWVNWLFQMFIFYSSFTFE